MLTSFHVIIFVDSSIEISKSTAILSTISFLSIIMIHHRLFALIFNLVSIFNIEFAA